MDCITAYSPNYVALDFISNKFLGSAFRLQEKVSISAAIKEQIQHSHHPSLSSPKYLISVLNIYKEAISQINLSP